MPLDRRNSCWCRSASPDVHNHVGGIVATAKTAPTAAFRARSKLKSELREAPFYSQHTIQHCKSTSRAINTSCDNLSLTYLASKLHIHRATLSIRLVSFSHFEISLISELISDHGMLRFQLQRHIS